MALNNHHILAVLVCVSLGCEQVAVNVSEAPVILVSQPGAMRVMVPASGIASLYDVANPEGLRISAKSKIVASDAETSISVGPLEQTLSVSDRTAESSQDQVEIETEFRNVRLFVPVRIKQGLATRICRHDLRVNRVVVGATTAVVEDEKGQRFSLSDAAAVTLENPNFRAIDPCDFPVLDFGADASTLEDAVENYVSESISEAAELAFEANPTETLGLLTRRVAVDRLSAFSNRRATLHIEGQVESFNVDENGLEISMDVGTDVEHADCAPPIDLGSTEEATTAAIDPALIHSFGADFGIAFSVATLDRIGRAMTLGGFACRGLEDVRKPVENQEAVPTPDLLLDQLGLGHLPLGPWAFIASSPGSLPVVKTRPAQGQLQLDWQDLTLDVYSDVQGARVKVLQLTTSATVHLSPAQGASGVVRFEVESINLSAAEIKTAWQTPEQQASPEDVDRWAQRILLLVLSEQFVFPIPVEPGTPLQLTGAQVRDDDIVLYVRFD